MPLASLVGGDLSGLVRSARASSSRVSPSATRRVWICAPICRSIMDMGEARSKSNSTSHMRM
jgi:hypothetical protein